MSDVKMKCIRRGMFHVERSADSAAGYALIVAKSRDEARQVKSRLEREEKRALGHENVRVKFGY